jgi:hypothetical protein
MGDGVLVYFGYPQVHEDDAEQAVRAGLALVDAVAKLPTADVALSARIGIATGVTVVGDLTGEGAARNKWRLVRRRTSLRACKRWRTQGQYSSVRAHASSPAGTSIIAISGHSPLKAGRNRYGFGRC